MDHYQVALQGLKDWLSQHIIGQEHLVQRLLLALLSDGHLLVEGAPGLAKTRAIKLLAAGIEGSFQRIQFTPDLLPSDVTGTDIYRPREEQFRFQQGPVFHNLILADEINRAPAKVQSALLEAMGERQVSMGLQTYPLPALFLVMATQNPLEQEGTYPLPEAQLDRFLLHVQVGYPEHSAEREILKLSRREAGAEAVAGPPQPVAEQAIFSAREAVLAMYMAEPVERYVVELVLATRKPAGYSSELEQWLEYGGSPRATIALDRCARAHAWLRGAEFVSPDDVQAVLADVLRHRLILSFEAEANGITSDTAIAELLRCVPVA